MRIKSRKHGAITSKTFLERLKPCRNDGGYSYRQRPARRNDECYSYRQRPARRNDGGYSYRQRPARRNDECYSYRQVQHAAMTKVQHQSGHSSRLHALSRRPVWGLCIWLPALVLGQMMSVYKSRHPGLFFSINASFHPRFHFFILFSLVMALCIVS